MKQDVLTSSILSPFSTQGSYVYLVDKYFFIFSGWHLTLPKRKKKEEEDDKESWCSESVRKSRHLVGSESIAGGFIMKLPDFQTLSVSQSVTDTAVLASLDKA